MIAATGGFTFENAVQRMRVCHTDRNDLGSGPSVVISECETASIVRVVFLIFL